MGCDVSAGPFERIMNMIIEIPDLQRRAHYYDLLSELEAGIINERAYREMKDIRADQIVCSKYGCGTRLLSK